MTQSRRFSFLRRALLGLACAVTCGATVPQPVHAQGAANVELISQDAAARLGLERIWIGQTVFNPQRDKIVHVILDEDNIYTESSSGHVTAFDAEDGRKLWSILLGRNDEPIFPITSNESICLCVTGNTMHALNKRTGKKLWSLRIPGAPSTGPAMDDKQVYVGTLDGSVYAFSLDKIRTAYTENRLPKWSYETVVWRYQATQEITSPPVITGRLVNFGCRDGSVYGVARLNRKLVFQFETNAPIMAPLGQKGDTLFVVSEDHNFYALNGNNGDVRWDFASGLPIRKRPIVVDDDLYLVPDRGGLFCLSVNAGAKKWWHESLTDFVATTGQVTYATDRDYNLVMLSREEGKILTRMSLRGYPIRVSNDRTDRVYVVSDSGLIVAMRPQGRSYPTFHKYPDRLPLIPLFEPEEGAAGSDAAPTDGSSGDDNN